MADAPETVATLNGLFKEQYADKLQDLVPNGTKFQKMVPFVPAEKELGKGWNHTGTPSPQLATGRFRLTIPMREP